VLLAGLGLMVAAERRLHLCRDLAAIDRSALSAGAGRRHRHGGEPRHHPRSLQRERISAMISLVIAVMMIRRC